MGRLGLRWLGQLRMAGFFFSTGTDFGPGRVEEALHRLRPMPRFEAAPGLSLFSPLLCRALTGPLRHRIALCVHRIGACVYRIGPVFLPNRWSTIVSPLDPFEIRALIFDLFEHIVIYSPFYKRRHFLPNLD